MFCLRVGGFALRGMGIARVCSNDGWNKPENVCSNENVFLGCDMYIYVHCGVGAMYLWLGWMLWYFCCYRRKIYRPKMVFCFHIIVCILSVHAWLVLIFLLSLMHIETIATKRMAYDFAWARMVWMYICAYLVRKTKRSH